MYTYIENYSPWPRNFAICSDKTRHKWWARDWICQEGQRNDIKDLLTITSCSGSAAHLPLLSGDFDYFETWFFLCQYSVMWIAGNLDNPEKSQNLSVNSPVCSSAGRWVMISSRKSPILQQISEISVHPETTQASNSSPVFSLLPSLGL